jgi:hypothetical protein
VGPRASGDIVEKRKNRPKIVQPAASSLYWLPCVDATGFKSQLRTSPSCFSIQIPVQVMFAFIVQGAINYYIIFIIHIP